MEPGGAVPSGSAPPPLCVRVGVFKPFQWLRSARFLYQVDKSNKRHLERLLSEGKSRIAAHMKRAGADQTTLETLLSDNFGTFKFKQF